MIRAVFGATGQMVVGISMFVAAGAQTVYWVKINPPPDAAAIFYVSMEALAYAAYGVVATALGYRATERVEQFVDPEAPSPRPGD